MTRIQFDTWVEKNYPLLLKDTLKMEVEKADAEDLLQDTLLYMLEHHSYELMKAERSDELHPKYFFFTYLKGIQRNMHKRAQRRLEYDALAVPSEVTTNPYPNLDAQIFIDELYNQVGSYTRMALYGMLNGHTMKEVYYSNNITNDYSYFLKQVKADLGRVL